jgi:hypothetical protein
MMVLDQLLAELAELEKYHVKRALVRDHRFNFVQFGLPHAKRLRVDGANDRSLGNPIIERLGRVTGAPHNGPQAAHKPPWRALGAAWRLTAMG